MRRTSGPTPRTEIGSVNSSRRSSMQEVYTFEEPCGDDDVLIDDADSSFGVLCNAPVKQAEGQAPK